MRWIRKSNSQSAELGIVTLAVITTILFSVALYLSPVESAVQGAVQGATNSGNASTASTIVGYMYQVSMANSSVSISPGGSGTVFFNVASPISSTFYAAVTSQGGSNTFLLPITNGTSDALSMPTGVTAAFSHGNVFEGSTSMIPVKLSIGDQTSGQTVELTLVVYQYQSGTYVGHLTNFDVEVS